jgi:hypothetical protein
MGGTPEELELRLDKGEWLLPGDVAILLGVDRSTVVRMLTAEPPKMRFRVRAGAGGYRECHPEDVRRELAERHRIHGA